MDTKASRFRKAALPLAVFLFMSILSVIKHEPWRDEAQSWLLARDLPLDGLFAALKGEGHPCLWFLTLVPFAKLGLSYWTMYAISVACMLVAGYLLLTHSPMPFVITLLCFFSSLMFYYLPVIARVYAVIPMLLMVLYTLYPKRHEMPMAYAVVLFLLSQTHVIMLGAVGALMLLWCFERLGRVIRKECRLSISIVCVAIMLAGVALDYATLGINENENAIVSIRAFTGVREEAERAIYTANSMLTDFNGLDILSQKQALNYLLLLPLVLLCVYTFLIWLKASWKSACVCASMLLWNIFVNSFVYYSSKQRSIIVVWCLLFCIMLAIYEVKNKPDAPKEQSSTVLVSVLCVAVAMLSASSVASLVNDIQWDIGDEQPYSNGIHVAEYINEELSDDAVIMLESELHMSSVAVFAKEHTFYNMLRDNESSFMLYDIGRAHFSLDGDFDASIAKARERYGDRPLYLLASIYSKDNVEKMMENSDATLTNLREWIPCKENVFEDYVLYRVNTEALPQS